MPTGIRATVEFSVVDTCPLVELSDTMETTIDTVHSNVCPSDDGESVVEFSLNADDDVETDLTPIFSHGSTDRFRITLDDSDCPCQVLGQFGCPVTTYVARNGTLTLEFHAADYEQLEAIIAGLRDRYPAVNIKRILGSPAGESSDDTVLVDRGKLTARQREVLQTAYELGYFERPRQINATEIAAELDINPSTFREHLTAAESKIFSELL